MAKRMVTFGDIIDAISEDIGVQASDATARNKIKRFINMCYIDEVIPFKRWPWLVKTTQITHNEYYNVGTVSVAPDSTAITLSVTPNVSEGSFLGHRFSVDGHNQVYTIVSHTAGSASATLNTAYKEALDATANYKIWRDRFDLPTDAKETIEIFHSQQSSPLEALGLQGFRKYEAASPKIEGYPESYHTGDFYDPSSGDDETESDRYRQTLLWPSITQYPITLNVDYVQEAAELDDETDEPLIPIGDRIVLYYGAGAMAWSTIARNVEESQLRESKYQQKLGRMAGEREDGMDTPSLSPKSNYLNNIRRSGLRRRELSIAAQGGSSSVALPSYLNDVVINGGNLAENLTADTGVLIDGRDVSADGILLDSLVTPTSVALADNTANQIAASYTIASYDIAHIQYSIHRGTAYEAGMITLTTNGTTASIAQGPVTNVNDVGVTFSVDVSSGAMRLLATTTSTGTAATFKYRNFTWAG